MAAITVIVFTVDDSYIHSCNYRLYSESFLKLKVVFNFLRQFNIRCVVVFNLLVSQLFLQSSMDKRFISKLSDVLYFIKDAVITSALAHNKTSDMHLMCSHSNCPQAT